MALLSGRDRGCGGGQESTCPHVFFRNFSFCDIREVKSSHPGKVVPVCAFKTTSCHSSEPYIVLLLEGPAPCTCWSGDVYGAVLMHWQRSSRERKQEVPSSGRARRWGPGAEARRCQCHMARTLEDPEP